MSHGINLYSRWAVSLLVFSLSNVLLSILIGICISSLCVFTSTACAFLIRKSHIPESEKVMYKRKPDKLEKLSDKEVKADDDFIKAWNNIMSYDPNEVRPNEIE
jgi:hypothetical protein